MGKVTGFMDYKRIETPVRDPKSRTRDWFEYSLPLSEQELSIQAARCMDCGVPFCSVGMELKNGVSGCPLHNLIPEWNDAVYRGEWREALTFLLKTNNFPEFTGRICPAPCEGSCTVTISEPAVGIKSIEKGIIERAFKEGWIKPEPPRKRTNKHIAITGSGPAGLACADQLNKAGHNVTVFEKSDRVGGLLIYGIPSMKLEKEYVDRRVEIMQQEGVQFKTGIEAGVSITLAELNKEFDAIVLATGASNARDIDLPGREASGIHLAVPYLTQSIKDQLNNQCEHTLSAAGKRVIVIGGGDTGADCVATALRQGAKSIHQFSLQDPLPITRQSKNPWPESPHVFKMEYAHEEAAAVLGKDPREYQINSLRFEKNERNELTGMWCINVEANARSRNFTVIEGSEHFYEADMVLIAIGFQGTTPEIFTNFGVNKTARHTIEARKGFYRTNVEKVFACGDARYGQSLVVTAISEGREAAREVDFYLMGETFLP